MNKVSVILLNALPDKKIKSLGNKCLIDINKSSNILDYHIRITNKIFKNPEIIVVGGYESKKLKKYIDNNYTGIKYIDHEIDGTTNIGTSIVNGLKLMSGQDCFIWNTSFILKDDIVALLKKELASSFILTSSSNFGTGCTLLDNNIIHCYYDLDNHHPLDVMFLQKKDLDSFYKLCDNRVCKLFFFEIINMCIQHNITIKSVKIPKTSFLFLDSLNTIHKMKSKHYV